VIKRTFNIDADYIHIPIKVGAPKNELQFWLGGTMLYQFSVELSDTGPYHYFFLNISELKNTSIDLVVPFPNNINQASLDSIFVGSEPEILPQYDEMYNEKLRPQFHFSSRRGWLNDPNGLYWHDGLYHLYYQHNPFGVLHGSVNISWGHAISEDLIHWQEQKDAILPWRREWMVASGSAFVDSKNAAGFGENAVIAALTGLGTAGEFGGLSPSGGQFLTASVDNGQTFYRFSQLPQIVVPDGADWRDPCLLEDNGLYYIAVYERGDDVHGVSFYKSETMRNWEFVSWIPDLFECPDLFKIRVEETGEEKWVLFGADGLARVGTFNEGIFTDEGIRFPLDYGTSTYAGQTWNHAPDNRRIHISWVRAMDTNTANWENDMGYHDMPFSQCMSVPCEIILHKVDDQYHLCRFPVKELDKLRIGASKKTDINLSGTHFVELKAPNDIVFHVDNYNETILSIKLLGYEIIINSNDSTVKIDDNPIRKLYQSPTNIRVLTDRTTVEIFIGDEVCATYATDTSGIQLSLIGNAHLQMQEWELSSVWHT